MPGTVIEMSERIVRKDISFMEPQRKFIEIDLRPLRATFVGITAKPNTKPSLSNTFPQTPLRLI